MTAAEQCTDDQLDEPIPPAEAADLVAGTVAVEMAAKLDTLFSDLDLAGRFRRCETKAIERGLLREKFSTFR